MSAIIIQGSPAVFLAPITDEVSGAPIQQADVATITVKTFNENEEVQTYDEEYTSAPDIAAMISNTFQNDNRWKYAGGEAPGYSLAIVVGPDGFPDGDVDYRVEAHITFTDPSSNPIYIVWDHNFAQRVFSIGEGT